MPGHGPPTAERPPHEAEGSASGLARQQQRTPDPRQNTSRRALLRLSAEQREIVRRLDHCIAMEREILDALDAQLAALGPEPLTVVPAALEAQ